MPTIGAEHVKLLKQIKTKPIGHDALVNDDPILEGLVDDLKKHGLIGKLPACDKYGVTVIGSSFLQTSSKE